MLDEKGPVWIRENIEYVTAEVEASVCAQGVKVGKWKREGLRQSILAMCADQLGEKRTTKQQIAVAGVKATRKAQKMFAGITGKLG